MKVLKWLVIILVLLAGVAWAAFAYITHNTKKASPEVTVNYDSGDLHIALFYNAPSKKGREIFGKLVPYGEVWRTGANEATTFATNQPLRIGGQELPPGKYTLWTIPGANSWQVIWNERMYGWGVNIDSKAAREPEGDVLSVEVPVQQLDRTVEQLDIKVREDSLPTLVLEWDRTGIVVPLR